MQYYITQEGLEFLEELKVGQVPTRVKRGIAAAGVLGAIAAGVKLSSPPSFPGKDKPIASAETRGGREPGAEGLERLRHALRYSGEPPARGARRVPGDAGRATTATTKRGKRGKRPETGLPVSDT